MGHSTINVTLGTYGHLFPAIDEQLDDALADRLMRSRRLDPHEKHWSRVVRLRVDGAD